MSAVNTFPATSTPSLFIRRVRAAILADLEPELVLASQVAVLKAAGYRRSEFARKLDATPAALRLAEERVKKAAERLDQGD